MMMMMTLCRVNHKFLGTLLYLSPRSGCYVWYSVKAYVAQKKNDGSKMQRKSSTYIYITISESDKIRRQTDWLMHRILLSI